MADSPALLEVFGLPSSPYTRKLVSVLRYKRILFRQHWHYGPLPAGYPQPKVRLLPMLAWWTEGREEPEVLVDSTPIIRRLDKAFPDRSVLPKDPVRSYLNDLIEDYADEWLTKAMFHYRWAYAQDAQQAPPLLIHHMNPSTRADQAATLAAQIGARQISRRAVVGSTDQTSSVIEKSFVRFIDIFDALIEQQPFLFGNIPHAADFALFGQLTQLVQIDPTPTALVSAKAPRVRAWVDRMEDMSGVEPLAQEEKGDVSLLRPLLSEVAVTYAPLMQANRTAALEQRASFTVEIAGHSCEQTTFPYHVKCDQDLRESHEKLTDRERAEVAGYMPGGGLA
ncbi:glutathione S-transferase family protein [Sulfitobacter aestuariivivens]|uniref:Glutathione S-transferase family protein n=1 Tax=Sulfitobacter aestuariivivens TaxID=2766981 RepID=A0A927HER7_9RHOB|nr:glutathione S-transferase family protein [Sulfitobacter aestuariivivens]MBD3664151.1 glutathione S-transferase family protein [Sulfitobacter aestuariivivens]